MNTFKDRPTRTSRLLFFTRLSLASLLLISCILLLTHLHPSPWLSTSLPLFLRPPPPLSLLSGATPPVPGCQNLALTTLEPREKGAIVLLLREQDLVELIPTLHNFEQKFNAHFRYPYVFLSSPDAPTFSKAFRSAVAKALPVGAVTEWGEVPIEHWSIPEWMDKDEVRRGFAKQEKEGVQYAGREAYHHMCRFYSGFWAQHPLLAKYDWYWRLEPGVRFYCSITYDPFRFLSLNNKVYGFVITIVETLNTIPTLFDTVTAYAARENITPGPGMWDFLTKKDEGGKEAFSLCHPWTNFEIGDLRFFRGEEYQALFRELDTAGGFFTERWGDAPIRGLALGLLTDINQVHYFEDIAYKHDWFMHCPARKGLGCDCDCPAYGDGFMDIDNNEWYSCLPKWMEASEKGWHRAGKAN